MRKFLTLLLAVAALAFTVRLQGRAKAADNETQLIQLERSWNQAEMGRDAGAIASLFDDSLVYVDYDGSLRNRAEYLRSVATPSSTPEHMYDEGMKAHAHNNARNFGCVSRNRREQAKTAHTARDSRRPGSSRMANGNASPARARSSSRS